MVVIPLTAHELSFRVQVAHVDATPQGREKTNVGKSILVEIRVLGLILPSNASNMQTGTPTTTQHVGCNPLR
jgi:hypothetical protein